MTAALYYTADDHTNLKRAPNPDPTPPDNSFITYLNDPVNGLIKAAVGGPPRQRRLDIFWFCGKGDEFETMVSWNELQVNLFIITPPKDSIAGIIAGVSPDRSTTAASKGVSLSWTPTASGGSPITGYRLYRGKTSGAETLLVSVGNVTSYTDRSAKSGVTYFYTVAAVVPS